MEGPIVSAARITKDNGEGQFFWEDDSMTEQSWAKRSMIERFMAKKKIKKIVAPAAERIAYYVTGIPENSRKTFDQLRAAAQQAAPADAKEVFRCGLPGLKRL